MSMLDVFQAQRVLRKGQICRRVFAGCDAADWWTFDDAIIPSTAGAQPTLQNERPCRLKALE